MTDKEFIDKFNNDNREHNLSITLGPPYYVIGKGETITKYDWCVWLDKEDDFGLVLIEEDLDLSYDTAEKRLKWLVNNYDLLIEKCMDNLNNNKIFRDFI